MIETANKKRALAFLRIIATILIVFHHYQQILGDFPGVKVSFYSGRFYFGNIVEFFFVLSGYLTYTNISKIENGLNFGAFYGRKAKRFLPWIFFSSLVYYLLHIVYVYINNEAWISVYPHWWEILINSIGMQSGWFFATNRLNFSLWYISVLFLCYGWFYSLTWVGKKTGIPRVLFYSFFVFIGIGIKTCLYSGILIHAPFFNGFSARGYAAFFFGLIVACLLQKKNRRDYYIFVGITICVLFAFCFINTNMLEYIVMIVVFALLIVLFSTEFMNKIINLKVFEFLGESTLYVYIWHIPALLFCVIIKDLVFHGMQLNSYFAMCIYTITLFLVGCVFHSLIKRGRCSIYKDINSDRKD